MHRFALVLAVERERGLWLNLANRCRQVKAEQLGHVFNLGQIGQIVQAKPFQE